MSTRLRDTARYQLMPDMSPAEFEALKADIAQRGVVVPIDIDETGEILDGHHRYRAWADLKKNEPPPTIVREGLSEQEKRAFARKNNILRRHLTREQIRRLIAEQLKDSPEWADNRIADELGVDHKTVGSVRDGLEATWEIPKLDTLVGKDGKQRPRKQPRKHREPVIEDDIDKLTEDDEEAELREAEREAEQSGRVFAKALRAYAEALGQELGDAKDLPDEIKLQMFAAGLSAGDAVVFKGGGPTDAAWECLEREEPTQVAIHRRCADFMAGPGGMAELAKTNPEHAEGIANHHDWMVRTGWTVEAWFGEEGERARARWGVKPRTAKQKKQRHAQLRAMIDAGVFGPPALDGRCHEW
jgi:ParB-like chromosome segregation protein Spo0J